jgi:heat shock protein HslJ
VNLRALPIAALAGSSYVLIALAAPPTLAGQGASKSHLPGALEGREWTISQYYIHEELLSPHLQPQWVSDPSIKFQDGAIYGSPGCGHFTGTYKRSGDSIVVTAKWSDDVQTSCNQEEKDDAAKMIEALSHVRRIGAPPSYWHDDSLLLNNGKGEIQVALSPKKSGNDLSEFHDTYWGLEQIKALPGSWATAVINIGKRDITFSTPSCLFAFPFEYEMTSLKFYPAWERTSEKACGDDWQVVQSFESTLHSISSYSRGQGTITFFDKAHQPIMTLLASQPTTIEDRTWRIAKYLDPTAKSADKNSLTDAKSRATISFVNGRVAGSPGCGGWLGIYKLKGVQLALDAGSMLAGRCERDAQKQSDLVVTAFKGNLRIEPAGDDILLRDEKGQARIELAPF